MMVIFEKGFALRHIGHLDLMRSMQRALRRSRLPIGYSQGFSPHVQLSFAAPLSVGVVGLGEAMDVPLCEPMEEEAFRSRLNQALPACLQARKARLIPDDFPSLMSLVQASRYRLELGDGPQARLALEQLPDFLALDTYETLRKTKSGEALCNIRPLVIEAQGSSDGTLRAVLAASSATTLKPALLVKALCDRAQVPELPFLAIREEILCRDRTGRLAPMEEYLHG